MADKLRLGCDVRELKIGASFMNDKSTSFHTLKCDFKPASVDANKMATVDVGTNNQVTVTVPHLDGAGVPQTVFKGNQRPYQKECVLIIDRITGEITLERLSSNIQVKKTRQEPPHKANPPPPRPPALDVIAAGNCTQRSTSRTRVATSGGRKNQGSSSKGPKELPPRHRTEPPQAAPWSAGQSTLASLPMIGLDDSTHPGMDNNHSSQIPPSSIPVAINGHSSSNTHTPTKPVQRDGEEVGILSSSSGSSSSGSESEQSDSGDSDSDLDNNTQQPPQHHRTQHNNHQTSKTNHNGSLNGSNNLMTSTGASMPMHLLKDDLRLSESGSDSD